MSEEFTDGEPLAWRAALGLVQATYPSSQQLAPLQYGVDVPESLDKQVALDFARFQTALALSIIAFKLAIVEDAQAPSTLRMKYVTNNAEFRELDSWLHPIQGCILIEDQGGMLSQFAQEKLPNSFHAGKPNPPSFDNPDLDKAWEHVGRLYAQAYDVVAAQLEAYTEYLFKQADTADLRRVSRDVSALALTGFSIIAGQQADHTDGIHFEVVDEHGELLPADSGFAVLRERLGSTVSWKRIDCYRQWLE